MKETPIRRALLSVSDKTGIVHLASGLRELGVEILSTGGTARALRATGIPLTEIDAFTGFPEMLDGRVKTLHPRVHAGILFRRDSLGHLEEMKRHGLRPIDLIAVNLYPFEETVARPDVTLEEALEQIDIGGPSMIRSAAKNHRHVTVVVSPARYEAVLEDMRRGGGATTIELRRALALEAFQRTADYDRAIVRYLAAQGSEPEGAEGRGELGGERGVGFAELPEELVLRLDRAQILRYGENPHQKGAVYGSFLERYRKLHGKEISYNNVMDLCAAQEVAEWLGRRGAAIVIVKHTNPCGAAVGASPAEAWGKALATDPVSAGGGIIASSRPIDAAAADAMGEHFIEILAAPGFEPGALEILKRKKNRILLETLRPFADGEELQLRSIPGGILAQTPDTRRLDVSELQVVTRRAPSSQELEALAFAWDVARFVKSNAIVYARPDRTLGIGAGQMSRVDAARIGAMKARDAGLDLEGCAVASDAFFPFPDGLIEAAEAGARAFIQPGGSLRDREVIEAADARGLAMVFTGRRHFRHG